MRHDLHISFISTTCHPTNLSALSSRTYSIILYHHLMHCIVSNHVRSNVKYFQKLLLQSETFSKVFLSTLALFAKKRQVYFMNSLWMKSGHFPLQYSLDLFTALWKKIKKRIFDHKIIEWFLDILLVLQSSSCSRLKKWAKKLWKSKREGKCVNDISCHTHKRKTFGGCGE